MCNLKSGISWSWWLLRQRGYRLQGDIETAGGIGTRSSTPGQAMLDDSLDPRFRQDQPEARWR
jgi:hypothetical protein